MSSFYVPVESLTQSRAFRRLLAWSLAGHVIVFLALVIHPFRSSELISTSPVMVQMVSMPKSAVPKPAPAKPAPAPKEKPPEPKPVEPPAPPKPVVKEIVIPKELRPEKPKPVEPKTPPPSAEELLAKMTEKVEAAEAAKAPPEAPAEEAPAAGEYSPGRFDPVLSPWLANVKARVRANWSGASVCKGVAEFAVDVDAGGRLTQIELTQSSGDSYCDSTGERALRKSNPLPPPPQAMSFFFNLDPKETQ